MILAMLDPEKTSAEAFERYVGGEMFAGRSRRSMAGHQSVHRLCPESGTTGGRGTHQV